MVAEAFGKMSTRGILHDNMPVHFPFLWGGDVKWPKTKCILWLLGRTALM